MSYANIYLSPRDAAYLNGLLADQANELRPDERVSTHARDELAQIRGIQAKLDRVRT